MRRGRCGRRRGIPKFKGREEQHDLDGPATPRESRGDHQLLRDVSLHHPYPASGDGR